MKAYSLMAAVGLWAGAAGAATLTWDSTPGDPINDGGGTWLNTGQWNNGSPNATWNNSTPDDAIIGSGGSGGTITLGTVTAGTVMVNNYSGTYTLSGGSLSQSGGITIGAGAGNASLTTALGGTGGVIKNNPGTLTIANTANSYSGATIASNGILKIGTGWGDSWTAGSLPNASNLEINNATLVVWFPRSANLGTGAGEVQLTGGTCGFTMAQGDRPGALWTINGSAAYEVKWGTNTFNPSVLLMCASSDQSAPYMSFDNKFDLNGATRTIGVGHATMYGQMTGVIRNTGGTPAGIIKTGIGELRLTAANTFDGGVTLNAGTVTLGHVSGLGSSSGAVTFTGAATLNLATFSPTVGALSSASGYGTIRASGAVTLTVSQTNNTTYSGVIQDGSGAVSLVKSGSGTLALSGTNTYTGATTVTNGTLTGVTGGSCANSAVTVTNTPGNTVALGVVVTSNTMQWTCASLTFKTNEVGAQLKFSFAVAPSTTLAPLNIAGDLVFSGAPLVVVDPANLLGGKTYPLLVVGGTPPTEVPPLSLQGTPGLLAWGGTGGKTLSLILANSGTVIVVR